MWGEWLMCMRRGVTHTGCEKNDYTKHTHTLCVCRVALLSCPTLFTKLRAMHPGSDRFVLFEYVLLCFGLVGCVGVGVGVWVCFV